MAPKKAVAVTNTSLPKGFQNKVSDESKTGAPEEPEKPTAVRKAASHPSTMEMVKQALKELDSRKGVSAQAIRGFIKQKYTTVDENRVKLMVRKTLVKGIESGVFVRPATSSTNTGAQGRFRLAVRKPKETKSTKKAKEAKENANPNAGMVKEPKSKEMGAEQAKPVKKVKAAIEKSKNGGGSKVAAAKKPKAKRLAGMEEAEPRPKSLKASKSKGGDSGKAVPKEVKQGAAEAEEGQSKGAAAAAPKKEKKVSKARGGKKAPPKAGDVRAEQLNAAPPKASARKGKNAA